jgi:hypothetical protein
MPQFVLLLVGRAAAPHATDAETQAYNARWQQYFGELAGSGALRAGAPLAVAAKLVREDSVTDLELDEIDIGGFLLIEAESIDAATPLAQRAPHIALGGSTIVRPCEQVR